MKITQSGSRPNLQLPKILSSQDKTPKDPVDLNVGKSSNQFLQRTGRRLLHGAKMGALGAALPVASSLAAFGVTAAFSAAMPAVYIGAGGFFLNTAVGALVGAGVGTLIGNKANQFARQ